MGVTPLAGPGQRPGGAWGEAPKKRAENCTSKNGRSLELFFPFKA